MSVATQNSSVKESKRVNRIANLSNEAWIPSTTQCVVEGLDALEKLVLVAELPANVVSKSMLDLRLSQDGTMFTIACPRPKSVSSTANIKAALQQMTRLDQDYVTPILIKLQSEHKKLRETKTDTIYDECVIPLIQVVDTTKSFLSKVFVCEDGSCGLICIFERPVLSFYHREDSGDERVETCGSEYNQKKMRFTV